MTRSPRPEGRPMPVFRQCDGVPWPSDHELELEAEGAARRESSDAEWWTGEGAARVTPDSPSPRRNVPPAGSSAPESDQGVEDWPWDDVGEPVDGDAVAVSDIDARLGHLERVFQDRQRATADEYRLILTVLDDAAFDPTPWVGPDPTRDRAWSDARGRTAGAVRRDRVDLAERAAVAEIALRLRLSEQTVRTRAAHARTLVVGCPQLWAAFSEGRLSEKHAVDAARLASTLPAGDADAFRRFDDEACPRALSLPPAKFAVAARAIRERVHAESIDARHRRAAEHRGVWMRPELDGMASLHALLPADRARAVMSQLDRAARHLRDAPDEERTLAQLRADALADLVTMVEVSTSTIPPSMSDTARSTPRASDHTGRTPRAAHETGHTSETVDATGHTPRRVDDNGHTFEAADDTGHTSDALDDTGHTSDALDGTAYTRRRADDTGHALDAVDDTGRALRPPPAAAPASSAPGAPRTFRSAPPATVVVTIPALTLLGHDTAPATLEGFGPIDLATARRLAGHATSWIRLLTHPVTGAPLVLDRKTYRVPAALRRWLGVTSPTCVFPGCGRAARECDIDHLTAWADGGTTDDDNLDPKCRHHHRLRHESRWDIDHPPGGDTSWTSPLGGRYGTDPPPF